MSQNILKITGQSTKFHVIRKFSKNSHACRKQNQNYLLLLTTDNDTLIKFLFFYTCPFSNFSNVTITFISIRGHSYFTDVLDITDCVLPSHVTVLEITDGGL